MCCFFVQGKTWNDFLVPSFGPGPAQTIERHLRSESVDGRAYLSVSAFQIKLKQSMKLLIS